MRTFVYADQKTSKFWNIALNGASYTVTFGKVGSSGRATRKDFAGEAQARQEHDNLIAEKLGKGYVETTPQQDGSPLTEALESALVDNPDDLAAHSAYADHLSEQGEPRGEFIQTQLALEDERRSAEERKCLRQRETELLSLHGRQWLGDVGRFLWGDWCGPDKPWQCSFVRGWLDTVRLLPAPTAATAALAWSPQARLLRRLEIVYDMRFHPFDFDQWLEGPNEALIEDEQRDAIYEECNVLPHLLESPYLGNLRVFKFGFSDDGMEPRHSTMIATFIDCTAQQILDLLARWPRLEELYLNTDLPDIDHLFASEQLGKLRVLQYYFGNDFAAYPLAALAGNEALRDLHTLRLHPGRDTTVELDGLEAILRSPNLPALTHLQVHMTTYGDEGARAVVESGILRRLEVLDIGFGNMTNEGARLLAACPDLKHLDTLNVSRNALTEAGIAALRATGVRVVADAQHGTGEDDNDYLYMVDAE